MKTLYTGLVCNNPDYIHTPLIEIKPLADDSLLRAAVRQWYTAEGGVSYLLFTSRYAVKYWSRLADELFPHRAVTGGRVVSIGPTTTKKLEEAGFSGVEQVEKDDSYGVVDWFSRQPRGRVLVPRSDLGLPLIPNGLKELGFDVLTVTAYHNRMPENPVKVNLDEVERIVFTSPSTIDNFISLYGSLPAHKQFVTRGSVTENHLKEIQNKIKKYDRND